MKPVVTLTVNPTADAACVADEVVPMHKVRTRDERYDGGGGGINDASGTTFLTAGVVLRYAKIAFSSSSLISVAGIMDMGGISGLVLSNPIHFF